MTLQLPFRSFEKFCNMKPLRLLALPALDTLSGAVRHADVMGIKSPIGKNAVRLVSVLEPIEPFQEICE